LVALELALGVEAKRNRACRTRRPAPSGSITSSAGASGLIFAGSPPISAIASRIAARSTTAGTPVKSCINTRAGVNAISLLGCDPASQLASASMSRR